MRTTTHGSLYWRQLAFLPGHLNTRLASHGSCGTGSTRNYSFIMGSHRIIGGDMITSAAFVTPTFSTRCRLHSAVGGGTNTDLHQHCEQHSFEGGASVGTKPTNSASAKSTEQEEAVNNLLEEVQALLSRPVPIGSLFRALSADSKKTLVKNKVPLEQLLLQYPRNFALYQQGALRNRTIFCSPPHLVPANARPMVLENTSHISASTYAAGVRSSSSPSSPEAPASSPLKPDDINARVLQHDPLSEKQQRLNTVLQYIPNEWSPFTELGIPEEVRVRCMGKPGLKAMQFFERYPQYFEVRQQGRGEHTFHVRRSMALQRSQEPQHTQ
ncbi:uncharacterized protein TEOVI_000541900 [Trypanosoma equiperdum]|uniref:Uncharacterized protein n=2 Tax=Trypanozoon TaxID=39700 RepID=Q57ZD0_TRYB2|nr:hypothetical protein, conserved [Trypanosoma brucei brucei TREU927]AAX80210.1 hypothetical protein, conserved [Trypanosoma brucei]AAZ10216.1 hypothetical protein, conserved [Trypanosoma brucei brucei TREU927]SCU64938.1 hypothetical protein, conserved [Trypanosoma equiperdum]